jgi:hypothetical protein
MSGRPDSSAAKMAQFTGSRVIMWTCIVVTARQRRLFCLPVCRVGNYDCAQICIDDRVHVTPSVLLSCTAREGKSKETQCSCFTYRTSWNMLADLKHIRKEV